MFTRIVLTALLARWKAIDSGASRHLEGALRGREEQPGDAMQFETAWGPRSAGSTVPIVKMSSQDTWPLTTSTPGTLRIGPPDTCMRTPRVRSIIRP